MILGGSRLTAISSEPPEARYACLRCAPRIARRPPLKWSVLGDRKRVEYATYMIDQSLMAKVTSLTPAERLELIGVVWDSLPHQDLIVSDAEKALLDARLADMERNPGDQSSWSEVKARLQRLIR